MPFDLGPEETLLYKDGRGTINVTSHRVVMSTGVLGSSVMEYVPLEKIDFVQQANTSKPRWLIIAAILGVLGLIIGFASVTNFSYDNPLGIMAIPVALIPGAIFLGIWFLTRKQTITIASSGGAIRVSSVLLGGDISSIIDAVESARQSAIGETRPPTVAPSAQPPSATAPPVPGPSAPPRVTLLE